MKLTKRQLRRIIEQAIHSDGQAERNKEAAYTLIYTAEYVREQTEVLYDAIWSMLTKTKQTRYDTRFKAVNALEDLGSALNMSIMALPDEKFNEIIDDSQSNGIENEASDLAKFDFSESAYKPIKEIDRLINQGTPMGMSVIDAMRHVGDPESNIGVAQRSTQFLVSLMDDDQTLEVFDKLDSHPMYREKR